MVAPKRPSLRTDSEASALEQVRLDLMVAIDRSHSDVNEARKVLERANEALSTAEELRDGLMERLRIATGDRTDKARDRDKA